ncbi:hypothetical protein OCS_06694 [Ophiocordyceps sinensis CO18]|uniref:Uncharacterized protein n=1 Tax=Ophiocordyceps sinensis (strain Co18 / CGMCC 3.14243) TaxID=911162 RepID=T4ZWV8_OPHSC|nr:hypothetical protein OCS_06694 [Ophiocordyceps sinensis CO18]
MTQGFTRLRLAQESRNNRVLLYQPAPLLSPPSSDEKAFLEEPSLVSADGGTHSAGFWRKKLLARIMMLTGSAGMIGKSSARGKCVRPNCR